MNIKDNQDKYSSVKEKFKDGDWVFGIGEHKGCSEVFTGPSGDFQPFSFLNATNPDDFRLANKKEISEAKICQD